MKNKRIFLLMLLMLVLLSLLAACSRETVSYWVGPKQAFTLLREKEYPWDDEYRRAIVVMSMPKCILRYKMPADKGDIDKVTLYDSGDGYYVLKDKAGQYTANLADCSMSVVENIIADPGELKGAFEMPHGQPPRFVEVPAKPKPKTPVVPAGEATAGE